MSRIAFAFALLLALPLAARAQDALINSAETIDKGTFKLAGFPILLTDGDSELGFGARAGYGFTPRFDVEAKLAFHDGFSYYGADAELWLVRGEVDFSVALGAHRFDRDSGPDFSGLDATALLSKHLTPRLELYGGLDLAFERPEGDDFTRANLVPGIELRLARDLDLLLEGGLALNDDSFDYLAFGLAYYFR